jgi:2-hydroxy-6-oxonona-2,4-dienedioate hydrolase
MTSRWCVASGYRLHARVAAWAMEPSVPVVCVHGWGVSSRYMVPMAQKLARRRHVYAPDLPGHGRSQRPKRALHVEEHAAVLVAWMDMVGLQRVTLIGNSMGCQIAADLAARHPERVDRLVFIGPTLDDEAQGVFRNAMRLLADVPFERIALVRIVIADYLRMGPRLLLQELRNMIADHELETIQRVRTPAIVIRGERDAVVPREWANTVANALRAGPAHEVKGWGHALNFSAPDELLRIVEPFLDAPRPTLASHDG